MPEQRMYKSLTAMGASVACVVALTLSGCRDHDVKNSKLPIGIVPGIKAAQRPQATIERWRVAVDGAFEKSSVENKEEGITTYLSLFPKKGGTMAFAQYDAFNKAYLFKPVKTQLNWDLGPNVRCYVVLRDGSSPFIVISPLYWSRDKLMGLRKIAVLVDGELKFEKEFAPHEIDRGHYGVGKNESTNVLLTDAEVRPLRTITKASKVSIRFTGEHGYLNLKKDDLDPIDMFKESLADSIFIFDSLERAVHGKQLNQPNP